MAHAFGNMSAQIGRGHGKRLEDTITYSIGPFKPSYFCRERAYNRGHEYNLDVTALGLVCRDSRDTQACKGYLLDHIPVIIIIM